VPHGRQLLDQARRHDHGRADQPDFERRLPVRGIDIRIPRREQQQQNRDRPERVPVDGGKAGDAALAELPFDVRRKPIGNLSAVHMIS